MDYKKMFEALAASENPYVTMGRSDYDLVKFLRYMKDVQTKLKFTSESRMLDVGGGIGYTSMYFSPFVKEVILVDYVHDMVALAKKLTESYENIRCYNGDILDIRNVVNNLKFDRILVGSVMQYLPDYTAVEKALLELFKILEPGGICLLSHNPDFEKKDTFIESYYSLDWPREKIETSIALEKKRFWFEKDKISKIANRIGFKEVSFHAIDESLFQSTHMNDWRLIK